MDLGEFPNSANDHHHTGKSRTGPTHASIRGSEILTTPTGRNSKRAVSIAPAVNGPFQDTPWIAQVFGAFLGLLLLLYLIICIVFAPVDLYRRHDIGGIKKTFWLAAFLTSAGIVWIIYGAVRFSRTGGTPGG
jgi:hypothetical protein